MARTKRINKSVYERIESKKEEITKAEEVLRVLNEELDELKRERDELQKQQLFDMMKEKGLSIEDAIALFAKQK